MIITELFKNPCTGNGQRLEENHLGGTSTLGDPDSWCPEVWWHLIGLYQINSMFDIGCGVGFTQSFFAKLDIENYGIDGEICIKYHLNPSCCAAHDLTVSSIKIARPKFDLVWSCEVFEHIEEKFVSNILETLQLNCGKVLGVCAAPQGAGGYHHVNCQNPEYWIEKISSVGFKYNDELTKYCRKISGGAYFRRSGLIFNV